MSFPPVIPDSFRRFDTRVSADDQFINSRDMVYARQNFNSILARRARWPLFSTTFTGSVTNLGYDLAVLGESGVAPNFLHIQKVRIPYYAPTIQIACYGTVNAASGTAWLSPYIHTQRQQEVQLDNSGQHTDGTTRQMVQLQIDIGDDQVRHGGFIYAAIGVAVEVYLGGVNSGDPETVLSAGSDWVITTKVAPQFAVNEFIFVTSKVSTTLRRITSVSTVADGSYYSVAPEWSYVPQVDETVNAQTLEAYLPDTITAWADRATVAP